MLIIAFILFITSVCFASRSFDSYNSLKAKRRGSYKYKTAKKSNVTSHKMIIPEVSQYHATYQPAPSTSNYQWVQASNGSYVLAYPAMDSSGQVLYWMQVQQQPQQSYYVSPMSYVSGAPSATYPIYSPFSSHTNIAHTQPYQTTTTATQQIAQVPITVGTSQQTTVIQGQHQSAKPALIPTSPPQTKTSLDFSKSTSSKQSFSSSSPGSSWFDKLWGVGEAVSDATRFIRPLWF